MEQNSETRYLFLPVKNLENVDKAVAKVICKLQSTPDSTEDIRKATSELCSIFSEYQLVWVSLMDYTALASTPEQQQDCEALEDQTRTCKSLVQAAVIEAINRKTNAMRAHAHSCSKKS